MRTKNGMTTTEGYSLGNVLASYAHLHFASNPALASAFVSACARFKAAKTAIPPRTRRLPRYRRQRDP
jgi:cobyrinic acid a,c-diamide synthase